MSILRRLTLVNAGSYDDILRCLLKCSKNTIIYTHYFALYRLSLFHLDVFIIYVTYSYTADTWFLLK